MRYTEGMSFAYTKPLLTPMCLMPLNWAVIQQQQLLDLVVGDSGLVGLPSALIFSFQLILLTSLPFVK